MRQTDLVNAVEALVDAQGLAKVLDALAAVCYAKAVRCGDSNAAWRAYAELIDRIGKD